MALRKWAIVALLASIVGCDALTDPTPTRTNVLFEGALTWGVCSAQSGCQARVESHNKGPGCARDPYGIFRLLDASGRIIFSGDWERPGIVWPEERFVIVIDGIPQQAAGEAHAYQTQGWWIATDCRAT